MFIINILTCIVIDITIGIGRSERRVSYNIAGLLYLFCLIIILFTLKIT